MFGLLVLLSGREEQEDDLLSDLQEGADLSELRGGDPNAVHGEYGEWFEVYNLRAEAVNLQGLIVTDSGTDSFTIEDSVMIAPASYFVLVR